SHQHRRYARDALLVQTPRLLDQSLLRGVRDLRRVRIGCLVPAQPRERLAREVSLTPQVSIRDELTCRMRREPALSSAEELVDLVPTNPVVLVVVEYRNEDIKVPKQILQSYRPAEDEVVVSALAPLGPTGIDRLTAGLDFVAQGREQSLDETGTATTRKRRDPSDEGDRRVGKFGALLRAPVQRTSVDLRDGGRKERIGRIRPVVDVLVQQSTIPRADPPSHQRDRVEVDEERSRTGIVLRLGVEDPRGSGGQLELLHTSGVLVQEVAKVRRGSVRCLDRQQHGAASPLRYLRGPVQTTVGDTSATNRQSPTDHTRAGPVLLPHDRDAWPSPES